ncbi:hypothetical protein [Arthrobacter sp. A5]|uniref:hypothetical protein n=1 Tax=Arthrobacter sp. A5 TaxID=576926 RepID=UPI003DA83DCD
MSARQGIVRGTAGAATALAVLLAAGLSGCANGGTARGSSPAPVSSASASLTGPSAGPTAGAASAGGPPSSTSASASSADTAGTDSAARPSAEPTAAAWKTYTDSAHRISFEVPQDWTVQQLADGPSAGAKNIAVKDADGGQVATLATGMTGLGGACGGLPLRPYTVLASVPVNIPSGADDAQAVPPRFVYRLLQGSTKFYASYGITDHSAGADGQACLIYNTVSGPGLGNYMFGDVLQFSSTGSPGIDTFDTIAEAEKHMLSSRFQNVRRMITSLKIMA